MLKMLMGGSGGGDHAERRRKTIQILRYIVRSFDCHSTISYFGKYYGHNLFFVVFTDIAAAVAATVSCSCYICIYILIINIKNVACYSLTYIFT